MCRRTIVPWRGFPNHPGMVHIFNTLHMCIYIHKICIYICIQVVLFRMYICVLKDTGGMQGLGIPYVLFIFPMSYIYAYVCRIYIYVCIGASFPKNSFASWRICVVCRVSESITYYPYLRCPTHIYILVGYIYTCIGSSFHDTRLRLERYTWCAGSQNPLCPYFRCPTQTYICRIYIYVHRCFFSRHTFTS